MDDLTSKLKPLLEASDIEGITALVEGWPQRDTLWEEYVEMRLHAPSSNAEQRRRLRELLKTHNRYFPRQIWSEIKAAAPAKRVPPAGTQMCVAPPADWLLLPELQQATDATAARLSGLPSTLATAAAAVLEHVRQQNLQHQAQRWEQFREELRLRRVPSDARFEDWLSSLSQRFVQLGPPATEAERSTLESIMPQPADAVLREFYQVFGGLRGEFGVAGLSVHLFSPQELLAAHRSSERSRRLTQVSLLDMARWSWGNDRPELDIGRLDSGTATAAAATVCLGWLSDGSCEQHAYLLQTQSGQFALHLWHQDNSFKAPLGGCANARGLLDLLAAVLAAMSTSSHEDGAPADLDALLATLGSD